MKHLKKYNESFENVLDIPTLKDIMYYITDLFDEVDFKIEGEGDNFKYWNNPIYIKIGNIKVEKLKLSCQQKNLLEINSYLNEKKSKIENKKQELDELNKKIDKLVDLINQEIPSIISILERYDNFEKLDFTLYSDQLVIVVYITKTKFGGKLFDYHN